MFGKPRPRYKRTPSNLGEPVPIITIDRVETLIMPNPDSQVLRDINAAIQRSNDRALPGSDSNKTPTQHAGDAFDTHGRTL